MIWRVCVCGIPKKVVLDDFRTGRWPSARLQAHVREMRLMNERRPQACLRQDEVSGFQNLAFHPQELCVKSATACAKLDGPDLIKYGKGAACKRSKSRCIGHPSSSATIARGVS